MKVNICGITYEVIKKEDSFNTDLHFGQIEYGKCEIKVNKDLPGPLMKETICHEMVHGMLVHLGYNEQALNEQFVQALGNAIAQGFYLKTLDNTEEGREE